MITADTYGAPNWVDLNTPDIEAALAFYPVLFDWEIESSETPMGVYHIGLVEGHQVAGMMQAGPETGDMALWTTFFNVEDLEDTVERVEAAGGTILQRPFDIPSARIAIVADPTGAMLGLFSGPKIEGVWLRNDSGAVSWVETLTRDPAASEVFYGSVFDWKAETQETAGAMYTTFLLGDDHVAGMMMMPDQVPAEAPAHWAVYFSVADCEETVQKAVELGGTVLVPTTEIGIGKFAVLADPQGASFDLMEHKE